MGGDEAGLPEAEGDQFEHLGARCKVFCFDLRVGCVFLQVFPVADVGPFGDGFGFGFEGACVPLGDFFPLGGKQLLEVCPEGEGGKVGTQLRDGCADGGEEELLRWCEAEAGVWIAQVKPHASGLDGGKEAVRKFGDQDDQGLGRWLFQCFQESVGCFIGQPVSAFDDDELGFPFRRPEGQEGVDASDAVDGDGADA